PDFFISSRTRHTRFSRDWSSDVCSSDLNGLLIYGVNGLYSRAKEEAKEMAKKEAYRFIAFARENLPGFEQAEISGFAEELYIRRSEERRVGKECRPGKYRYSLKQYKQRS